MSRSRMKGLALLAAGLLVVQAGCKTETVAPTPAAAPKAVNTADTTPLNTKAEMTSYAIGVDTARNYKRLGVEINPDMVARGMKDVAAGKPLMIANANIDGLITDFRAEMTARARGLKGAEAYDNQMASEAFLAANKTKEGVVTLPSGLQFKVLKAGTGKVPTDGDTVEFAYVGTLMDGTVFDSSKKAGQLAVIEVSNPSLIAGFKEALKLMPVGSTWQLFIPPRLAYMDKGKQPLVGPNALLIYEVELRGIQ